MGSVAAAERAFVVFVRREMRVVGLARRTHPSHTISFRTNLDAGPLNLDSERRDLDGRCHGRTLAEASPCIFPRIVSIRSIETIVRWWTVADDARSSRARAPSKRPTKRTESVPTDANRRSRRSGKARWFCTCAVLAVGGARRPAPSVSWSVGRVQLHLRRSCAVSHRSSVIGEDVVHVSRTRKGAAWMDGDADRAKTSARFAARRRFVDGEARLNHSLRCAEGTDKRTDGSRTCTFAHACVPHPIRRRIACIHHDVRGAISSVPRIPPSRVEGPCDTHRRMARAWSFYRSAPRLVLPPASFRHDVRRRRALEIPRGACRPCHARTCAMPTRHRP